MCPTTSTRRVAARLRRDAGRIGPADRPGVRHRRGAHARLDERRGPAPHPHDRTRHLLVAQPGEYWVKGETSGHHQYVRSVKLDCDGDTLLLPWFRSAPPATPARTAASSPPRMENVMTTGGSSPGRGDVPPSSPRTRRVVPVIRRLLADAETPVGVYRKLAGGPGHVPARVGRAGRGPGEGGRGVVAVLVHRGA